MAFRFQSALAGAATTLSGKLKTLETETKDLIKTEAARVADQMEEQRKQRIKQTLDYNTQARFLKHNYSLNDSQVEAILSGGLENAKVFQQSMKDLATQSAIAGTEFNREEAVANLLPTMDGDFSQRSIEEQAEAFAFATTPQISADIKSSVQTIGAGISGMAKGPAPTDYIQSQLEAQLGARAGQQPDAFTGRAIGVDTGYQFKPVDVDVQTIAELEAVRAGTARTEAQIGLITAQTATEEDMLPLKKEELEAHIAQRESDKLLTDAQADRLKQMTPLLVDKSKVEIDQIIANTNKIEQTIYNMFIEGEKTEQEIKQIRAATDNILSDTKIQDALAPLQEDELRAKIEQITATTSYRETATTQLEQEIAKAEKKTPIELEAAGIELDTARENLRILREGTFSDVEELQVSLINENRNLNEQLINNPQMGDAERSKIESKISRNEDLIISAAIATSAGTDTSDYFSTVNPVNYYDKLLKQNLTALNVDFEFSSFDEAIASIEEDKRPAFFAAATSSLSEFDLYFTGSKQADRFVYGKALSINNAIRSYAQRDESIYLGPKTLDEIGNLTDVKEGQVVSYVNNQTGDEHFMVYSSGQFVSPLDTLG
jgi:hypothetical protein